MKILIADDMPSVHAYIENSVDWSALFFDEPLHAYDGGECLRVIERHRPGIMLLDIRMPVLDGIGVLRAIYGMPDKPRTIMLTAYAEFEYAQQVVGLKASDYLLKPIDQQKLTAALLRVRAEIEHEQLDRLSFYLCHTESSAPLDALSKLSNRKLYAHVLTESDGAELTIQAPDGLSIGLFRTPEEDASLTAISQPEDLLRLLSAYRARVNRDDPIRDVMRYITEHFDQELTLEGLASQFYLSRYDLSRRFKQRYSRTLWEHIKLLRLERSKELLRDTDKKMQEIAWLIGYKDATYFSSLFHKAYGMSPQQYRRQFELDDR